MIDLEGFDLHIASRGDNLRLFAPGKFGRLFELHVTEQIPG
jgi:hypothetical protein